MCRPRVAAEVLPLPSRRWTSSTAGRAAVEVLTVDVRRWTNRLPWTMLTRGAAGRSYQ